MKLQLYPIILLMSGLPAAWSAEPTPPVTPEIRAASERGEAAAQFQMARACLYGAGVPKDVKKAFELMKSAADRGYPDAIGGLGYFYSAGVAVNRDDKQAAEWFRKGAEKGSAKAQLNLAKLLLSGKPGASAGSDGNKSPEMLAEEGLQWMKKAADQGLPEAGLAYGSLLYFGGHGTPVDFGKAAPYLKTAAEAGIADARNMLGTMCQRGLGLPVDASAAEQWFRKAALQGHVKAQSNLGNILGPESINQETRIEALAWLMIASSQGEVTAEKSLQDLMPGLKAVDLDSAKSRAQILRNQIRKK
jgi:TPR repeat protein